MGQITFHKKGRPKGGRTGRILQGQEGNQQLGLAGFAAEVLAATEVLVTLPAGALTVAGFAAPAL
jgi:hypothetical protein